MGFPPIKLPGGGHIYVGRILRTLLGTAIIIALIFGWAEAHDKIELGIWLGLAVVLIDPALVPVAIGAVRAVRNGNGKR